MLIETSYNYRRVSDNLTTSGVVGEARLRNLSLEGYKLVINLLPNNSKHALQNERALVESQAVKYVHIPVDFERPTRSDFERFATAMDEAGDCKVHVHCAANYRVSAFYSIYAVTKGLWSQAEAKAFVMDLWNPAEFPAWQQFISRAGKV